MTITYIDEDFVTLRDAPASGARRFLTLAFGDPVEVLGVENGYTKLRAASYFDGETVGYAKGTLPTRGTGVLSFSLVDVQQGDGMILETPGGKVVFIDGGDTKLFARHAAARFRHRHTSAAAPLEVDAIIVTHGDADHFDGLTDIVRSEQLTGEDARKRLFIRPRRLFHNGLVKGPTKRDGHAVPEVEQLGRTVLHEGVAHVVDLFDDTRDAAPSATNTVFDRWHRTLGHWEARGPIAMRRVAHGMDPADLFGFLAAEGVAVDILGPFTTPVFDPRSGATVPALPFLTSPKESAVMHLERGEAHLGKPSASHTINGHSVALRLTFGNVRFQLTGDLNRDAMQTMLAHVPATGLEAEIVKAPHHGSADFDLTALTAMKAVVALVSSGDENAGKEYIHPRATLMSALGHAARGDTGLVFCTELAAFFSSHGDAYPVAALERYFEARPAQVFTGAEVARLLGTTPDAGGPAGRFFSFERTNFGIVHVRTDGQRVLVFTHSGKKGLNEAYRFTVSATHDVVFERQLSKR
jgi:beta-lactamase superfamily II metal-dependent hydrolase